MFRKTSHKAYRKKTRQLKRTASSILTAAILAVFFGAVLDTSSFDNSHATADLKVEKVAEVKWESKFDGDGESPDKFDLDLISCLLSNLQPRMIALFQPSWLEHIAEITAFSHQEHSDHIQRGPPQLA